MTLAPGLRRPKNGRIRQASVNQHPDLVEALRRYGREQATPEEKLQMVRVDLDTSLLFTLIAAREGSYRKFLDQPVGEALKASHRTLTWLTRAPINPRLEDHGIEGWLRQYVMAELFAESMLQRVGRTRGELGDMNQRLRDFFEWLGQIADDFAAIILGIRVAPQTGGHFEEEEGTLPEGPLFRS
jgi:hypothetical protein